MVKNRRTRTIIRWGMIKNRQIRTIIRRIMVKNRWSWNPFLTSLAATFIYLDSGCGLWLLPILDSGDCYPYLGFWLQIPASDSGLLPFWHQIIAPLLTSNSGFCLRILNCGCGSRILDCGLRIAPKLSPNGPFITTNDGGIELTTVF